MPTGRRSGALLGIDVLDIFSLVQGTLVRTQSILGKLVDALVGTAAARLDHVENPTLVGTQSNNFAGNFATECSALAEGLWGERERERE